MRINHTAKKILVAVGVTSIVIAAFCPIIKYIQNENKAVQVSATISTSEMSTTTTKAPETTTEKPTETTEATTKITTKKETTKSTTKKVQKKKKSTTTSEKNDSDDKSSEKIYSASTFKRDGVLHWGGWRWTWYSERVLPGGGLNIPGRHADGDGYICDENNYICVASSTLRKGTVIDTPLGKKGKVYDSGCASDIIDVYVSW